MSKTILTTIIIILIGIIGMLFLLKKNKTNDDKKVTSKQKTLHAWLDEEKLVLIKLKKPIKIETQRKLQSLFDITNIKNKETNILKVVPLEIKNQKSSLFKVYTSKKLNPSRLYFADIKGFKKTQIIPRFILNSKQYFYEGDDLGFTYKNKKTVFKLWAPTAQNVKLLIFDNYNDDIKFAVKTVEMKKHNKGVWSASVSGDFNGKYYLYEVSLYEKGRLVKNIVADPYSKGSGVNSCKSLVFDSEAVNKEIPDWNKDKFVSLKNNVDAFIYELHVRDYTIDDSSGISQELKGKYEGLTKQRTVSDKKLKTVMGNLEELGITHAHLLPTYDYGTGDEAEINSSYTWYNWGYDPVLYFNPEGSYSTFPNGTTRISDYKKMVKGFHDKNIGVVFDVVFNHTFETGKGKFSIFDKIVPMYFYRVKDNGEYSNGSFCGNEVATERPMVSKYIVDNLTYWVKEYHIDGLRFDLMGLIDKETMIKVYRKVKKINPNAILYGEGWNMPSVYPSSKRMIQTNVVNTGIAAFNDGIRDNLKGDVFENNAKGFVQGATPMTGFDRLKLQIKGQSTGRDKDSIPVANPNETVNYVSCHDNLCIWDKLKIADPEASVDKIKKMDLLTFAVVATSQGIPFLGEGDEFGRTKKGIENSFDDNDPGVNPINWNFKDKNYEMFLFYKGMIELRKKHPAFRMTSRKMVDKNFEYLDNLPENVIAYTLSNNANGDEWKTIFVAFNSSNKPVTIELDGSWNVVVEGDKAGTEILKVMKDRLVVPVTGTLIAYKN